MNKIYKNYHTIFSGLFFLIVSNVTLTQSLSILFVLNRFPMPSKSIVINQIVSCIANNHMVHIYTKEKGDYIVIDDMIEKYDLLNKKKFFISRPHNLDYYDIILVQYGDLAQEFVDIKKKQEVPWKLAVYFRGADITADRNVYSEKNKELFKYADLILAVCDYYKYRLITLLGCPEKKIKVIPSAIDCNFFLYCDPPLRRKKIRILSVGRLVEKKGIQYVIKAVAQLHSKGYPVYFDIIGDGKYKSMLVKLVQDYNLQEYILFHGWKNQKEMIKFLFFCDIFALPSITVSGGTQEGIANALKEAMAVGRPVIATYHAGTAELIEQGLTGFLVPERDVASLVKKLIFLIKKPYLRKKIGRQSRQKVCQKYDVKLVNKEFETVLQDLVKGRL